VIGTGSSGIQSIPLIAEQASQLTVYQRTPNFSVPAHNGPSAPRRRRRSRPTARPTARPPSGRAAAFPPRPTEILGITASDEVRRERFEAAWDAGELFEILGIFADQGIRAESNEIVAEMIRERIREIVDDPETAEALCPYDHYFGTKRPCLDTNYYATFNLPHVELVNLRESTRSPPSPRPASRPRPARRSSTPSSTPPGSTR
jgi:cation diffusion facilitator CzcD-associated flavoprotein CzcO